MGALAARSVVLVRFPFSDLSQSKLRPAAVLADCSRDDWLLCQITSNPYSDARAVKLGNTDFDRGSLRAVSYARPARLFTAHNSLITTEVGFLSQAAFDRILDGILKLLGR